MAEIYRFFNSTETDKRTYNAEDFADYFKQFLTSGVVYTEGSPNLQVIYEGNKICVNTGSAIVKGHMYKSTEKAYLDHQLADPTLNRIDRIVLRYDGRIENRFIKLQVLTGTPSVNPTAPNIWRNDDIFELVLADVLIKANTVVIEPSSISDQRLNNEVCGIVSSLVTVPLEKFQQDFNLFKTQLNTDFYDWFDDVSKDTVIDELKNEIRLISANQIELLMQRYLENQATTMDAGYWYDVLSDTSKINTFSTNATIDTANMEIKSSSSLAEDTVIWNPHPIGFVADKVTYFQTRKVGGMVEVVADSLSGQNTLTVASLKIDISEVK